MEVSYLYFISENECSELLAIVEQDLVLAIDYIKVHIT